MKEAVKELCRLFPNLDALMAETILKMHEEEKLSEILKESVSFPSEPEQTIFQSVFLD